MDLLIHKLETGKESCHQIISILKTLQSHDHHQGDGVNHLKEGLDHHSKVVQTTLDDTLSMLRRFGSSIDGLNQTRNTKARRTDMDEFGVEVPKVVIPSRDRRGCYERRRNEMEIIIETMSLTDDGHGWRKYGQKDILHAKHPRNYYRCTHKYEERCEAKKQVQQISENPTKYKIIYHGQHTCKASTSKTNNPTNDSIDNSQNSILLSFETPKHAHNYPFMFPPATPSSSGSSGLTTLSGYSVKEEMVASEPLVGMHGYTTQFTSSTPDHHLVATPETGGTGVTAVSDNAGDVSSGSGMDTEECYSGILGDDLIDLDDLYDDEPNPPIMVNNIDECIAHQLVHSIV